MPLGARYAAGRSPSTGLYTHLADSGDARRSPGAPVWAVCRTVRSPWEDRAERPFVAARRDGKPPYGAPRFTTCRTPAAHCGSAASARAAATRRMPRKANTISPAMPVRPATQLMAVAAHGRRRQHDVDVRRGLVRAAVGRHRLHVPDGGAGLGLGGCCAAVLWGRTVSAASDIWDGVAHGRQRSASGQPWPMPPRSRVDWLRGGRRAGSRMLRLTCSWSTGTRWICSQIMSASSVLSGLYIRTRTYS